MPAPDDTPRMTAPPTKSRVPRLPLAGFPVARVLGKPLILRLLLLLLVIEAIFLAESFTTLMEHALRYGGGATDVLHLLGFKVPEILDLALAIGLLIATYFATQDARNRGELIILATAGIHWGRVIAFVLLLGTLGGMLSFLNAGLLLPMSKYGERLALAELQKNHVLSQIENGSTERAVQTIRDTTFIALPPANTDNATRGQLFIFQPNVNGNWRAAQSQNWQVTDPAPADNHKIQLNALSVFEAPYPTNTVAPLNRFATAEAEFAFAMSDALPTPDQTRTAAERLLNLNDDTPLRLTQLISRALMVPMAGLLALAALVASGAGPLRHAALPLAALLLLSSDVTSRALLTTWAHFPSPLLIALALLLYLGPPLAYLLWRGEALMKPDRART